MTETIPVALEVARLMETVGVEPALEKLLRLGGDADTIGSIAGQTDASLVLEIAVRFAHFAASA